MKKSKESIAINPLKITFSTAIGMYIIFAFFDPINILHLLTIVIVIFIFSFALITIIFNLSPILLSLLRRVNNILPSVFLLMLTSFSIFANIQRPIFNTEVINMLLIFTLLIIGCIYVGFALINTGFPKWHRQINILIGSFSIISSVINITVPILGYTFLTTVICALITIDKIKILEIL